MVTVSAAKNSNEHINPPNLEAKRDVTFSAKNLIPAHVSGALPADTPMLPGSKFPNWGTQVVFLPRIKFCERLAH